MNKMILIEVVIGRKINESSGMMPPTSLVPSSRGSRATVPTTSMMGGGGWRDPSQFPESRGALLFIRKKKLISLNVST